MGLDPAPPQGGAWRGQQGARELGEPGSLGSRGGRRALNGLDHAPGGGGVGGTSRKASQEGTRLSAPAPAGRSSLLPAGARPWKGCREFQR